MGADLALPRVVFVTGTTIRVGKTTAVAALASILRRRGLQVAAVKLIQPALENGRTSDPTWVRDMAGDVDAEVFYTLPVVMGPAPAARMLGLELPLVASHAKRITALAESHDVVLVEGSGGLLVRLDGAGGTIADLAMVLRYKGISAGFIVVATVEPGMLNLAALTAEALEQRGLPLLGVILAHWPDAPSMLEEANRADVPEAAGGQLLGVLPVGIGELSPADFAEAARRALMGV